MDKRVNGPVYNRIDGDDICSWFDGNDFEESAARGSYVKIVMDGQIYDEAKILSLDEEGMDLDVGMGLVFSRARVLYSDIIDISLLR